MATNSMIPYSNPAGKNQTSPASPIVAQMPTIPTTVPTNPAQAQQNNPLIPSSIIPTSGAPIAGANPGATGTDPNSGFITSGMDGDRNALEKQLTDIYGKGTGGSLFQLLNNMSGTNSTVLQEFINSLKPQEAKAQANIDTSLGAAGVSQNSSVAALADANLQAQEFGLISQESADLTKSQEELTAKILGGTMDASSAEVAQSGWDVFGQVIEAGGKLASDIIPLF